MREILFRGKRLDNGEWVYGNYTYTDSNEKHHYIFQNTPLECEVATETVGQFTGLLDKNGTKIFEGDIVRRFNSKGQEVMCYAVKWNADCCMFVLICEDTYSSEYDTDFTVFYGEELEIIGNVHDNPELLKGENVQSVVHAKWTVLTKRKAIFLDNANEQYKALGFPHRNILQMRCSNCGVLTQVDDSIAYEYCPHCGAKMDGD